MSSDLMKRLRDALSDVTHKEFTKLIAEADAHLSSAGQSREEWLKEVEKRVMAFGAASADYAQCKHHDLNESWDAVTKILRAVPTQSAATNRTAIVAMSANADDMNALYGDQYGVDWVYPAAMIAAAQEGK